MARIKHPLTRSLCEARSNQVFEVDGEEYVLGGRLGDGAVGIVRRGTRTHGKAVRAVKFLAPDPKYIDENVFDDVAHRFRREGERGSKLDHPHLVKVFRYCENEEGCLFEDNLTKNPFLLMELVPGKRTLDSKIKGLPAEDRQGFDVTQERLNIAIQVASALKYLQTLRLVHRDVKPANIFIRRRRTAHGIPQAKLGDFGVTKWGDFNASFATGTLTVTHQKGLGTLKYMSPEQALSPKDVGVRSDIYSFGITLFELFTGQILGTAHHVYQIMNARMRRGGTALGRFLSIGHSLRGGDEHLAAMILDMFHRSADSRPSINTVLGTLQWEYESRFSSDWRSDISQ